MLIQWLDQHNGLKASKVTTKAISEGKESGAAAFRQCGWEQLQLLPCDLSPVDKAEGGFED
jgi:hypothetical protein